MPPRDFASRQNPCGGIIIIIIIITIIIITNEIATKSPLLRVKRSSKRYVFRVGARAIRYSVKNSLVRNRIRMWFFPAEGEPSFKETQDINLNSPSTSHGNSTSASEFGEVTGFQGKKQERFYLMCYRTTSKTPRLLIYSSVRSNHFYRSDKMQTKYLSIIYLYFSLNTLVYLKHAFFLYFKCRLFEVPVGENLYSS